MTLPDVLKAARQRWWILLLCLVISVVLAYSVSSAMTPMYEAEATALLEHSSEGNPGSELQSIQVAERRSQTFSQLITTRSVLAPVIETLEIDLPVNELRENVSVTSVRESQLITIVVTDSDPERAASIANAIAEQFSSFLQEVQGPVVSDTDTDLSVVVAEIDEQLTQAQERISELEAGVGPVSSAEEDELEGLQGLVTQLEQSLGALEVIEEEVAAIESRTGSQFSLAEPASAPSSPVSPRVMLNVGLAGVLGLLIGGGAVVGIAWLDDKVKSEQDIRQIVDRPVLGTVPLERLPEHMEDIHAGRSISGEIFRGLRTNLQFTMVDRKIKSIVVTSVFPGEGKTTVATNLAIVLAQGGQRVILVDADMRRPQVHSRFNKVRNDRGLSNLLLQSPAVIEDMVQSTTINNLKVLATGPLPPNPPDLLGSSRMRALVNALEETADIVIFDSPPLAISESLLLSSLADGILMVVRAGRNRTGELAHAYESASQTGVPILGVILNGVSRDSQAAYRVYQQYYPLAGDDGETPVPQSRLGWLGRVFGRSA